MGEKNLYQPLTRWDAITVILYRLGIALSSAIISIAAFGFGNTSVLLIALYASVGLSVWFIHLYIGRFKRMLMGLYLVSLLSLAVLLLMGKGAAAVAGPSIAPLLLLPLSGCLGFITAKEAFCFRLTEGYLLAVIMPLYLISVSAGMKPTGGLVLIAVVLAAFTLRKVFQPIHWDIGDKSAYR